MQQTLWLALVIAITMLSAARLQALELPAGAAASAAAEAGLRPVSPDSLALPNRSQAIARAAELINNIRARLDACGDTGMLAADRRMTDVPMRPALRYEPRLASAADAHSTAMVVQRFFAHADPQGKTVGARVTRTGYHWQRVGENLAAGHRSIDAAVQGWLLSPTHCEVLLDPRFTEFGIARRDSTDPRDPYGVYWTLVVAQP